ncbi:hypothetical protein [Pantoea ananatis]|uniref:hypothetical protein n=1 Tax=Pantoea ananas TaxID=553 RepID=UPI001B30DEB8|nr:hypothetical protein [Pantoea ananatis]
MVSLWTAILVALVSAASAILAAYMTNRASERRLEIQAAIEKSKEFDKIKLMKAEEVYSEILLFQRYIFSTHMAWVNLSREKITITQLNEFTDKYPAKASIESISTKLGIFFPHLHEKFEKNRKLLSPANDCFFEMTSEKNLTLNEKKGFANQILDAGKNFDGATDEILKDISKHVSKMLSG